MKSDDSNHFSSPWDVRFNQKEPQNSHTVSIFAETQLEKTLLHPNLGQLNKYLWIVVGGLSIVGLFLGLYFGLGYPDAIGQEAAHGFLRCQHGWDLINGKCLDIDECFEHKGTDFNSCSL